METLTTPLVPGAVHRGATHTFTAAVAAGDDQRSITWHWFRGDQEVLDGATVRIVDEPEPPRSTLTLTAVSPDDAGTWSVLAQAGTEVVGMSTTTLYVVEPEPQAQSGGFVWRPLFAGVVAAVIGATWLAIVLTLREALRGLVDSATVAASSGGQATSASIVGLTEVWRAMLSLALFATALGLLAITAGAFLVEVRGRARTADTTRAAVAGPETAHLRLLGGIGLLVLAGAIALVWG